MVRKNIGRKSHSRKVGAKPKRRTHHRRGIRGVGDIGGMAEKAGGLVLGAVAARELNTIVSKMGISISPLVSGLLQMGVGFFLPKLVKGQFVAYVADGMIANGGMVAIVSTGVISGTDTMTYRINGTSNMQIVNGTPYIKVINGGDRTDRTGSVVPRVAVRNFSLRG